MSSAHFSRLLNLDVNWASGEVAAGGGPAAAPTAGRSASSGITVSRCEQLRELFEALDRDPYGRVKIDYDTFLIFCRTQALVQSQPSLA